MSAVSLLSLNGGPLPEEDLKGAVIVTIWLFFILACCVVFLNQLRVKDAPIWPEFQRIFYGCLLLFIWYLIIVIDRWMHWDGWVVPFGYILLAPISEIFRVASTILFLSGTFRVVWKEVNKGERKAWRIAGKIASFFSVLPTLFYIILYIALAACWLRMTSLNTIADIASRKIQFQIAMSAIFAGYALVSATAATVTWCIRKRSQRGYVITNRLVIILAALLLAARCSLEFVLTLLVWINESYTRETFQFIFDCAYGAISIAFIACHLFMSNVVGSRSESGGKDVAAIQSNIRNRIIDRLREWTDDGKKSSPPLEHILREIEGEIKGGHFPPDLFMNSTLDPERNQREALKYLDRLRREEGGREAKLGTEEAGDGFGSRATSAIGGLFSRMSDTRGASRMSRASKNSLHSQPSGHFSTVGSEPVDRPPAPVQGMGMGPQGQGPRNASGLPSILEQHFAPADSFHQRSVRSERRPGL